ncbi:MAG: SDR family NAD(P)-dependent oxidoreductase, partial [Pseudomonas neustonica]
MTQQTNKVALVTGAGSGIGRASALALLSAGYQVVMTGRRMNTLQASLQDAGTMAKSALLVESDVRDPDSVAALFQQIQAQFGRLDLLFNNAGTGAPPVLLEDISFEHWRAAIDTNLTGAFL